MKDKNDVEELKFIFQLYSIEIKEYKRKDEYDCEYS